ncbi:hypothetical protein H1235_09640 [Pseudoxanthomonas sp. NC8]|nr:hypothetical protein H1235_09640 [Pseudoxanthomonas sp. NC8]
MTILRLLVLVAFLTAGLVVGSLNPQRILLDFGVVGIATTTGIAITASLLAGVLLGGGIVMATAVLPLQARLRRANRPATPAIAAPEGPRPPYQGT